MRASLVALIVAGGRELSSHGRHQLRLATLLAAAPAATSVAAPPGSAATTCTHVGGSSRCPWDELHFSCAPSLLAVEYNISAYSGEVNCGSLFLESDIGGGINVPPLVSVPAGGAQSDKFYTLIMVDPDADMNGSFPYSTAPGPHAPVRHWVVGNILGSDLMAGSPFNATTVSPFHGPSPPSGSHRCCFAPSSTPRGPNCSC